MTSCPDCCGPKDTPITTTFCTRCVERRLRQVAKYRTIVADPPWHYERTGVSSGAGHMTRDEFRPVPMPYPTMSVEEIALLPVKAMAEKDAHLYLWTTQRYLRDSFDVAAWIAARQGPRRQAVVGLAAQDLVACESMGAPLGEAFSQTRRIPRHRGERQPRPVCRTVRAPLKVRLGLLGRRVSRHRGTARCLDIPAMRYLSGNARGQRARNRNRPHAADGALSPRPRMTSAQRFHALAYHARYHARTDTEAVEVDRVVAAVRVGALCARDGHAALSALRRDQAA
jgi:hypothetical protein